MNKGMKALFNTVVEMIERLEQGQERLDKELAHIRERQNQQLNQGAAVHHAIERLRENISDQASAIDTIEHSIVDVVLTALESATRPTTGDVAPEPTEEAEGPENGSQDAVEPSGRFWQLSELYADKTDPDAYARLHPTNPDSPHYERWLRLLEARQLLFRTYQRFNLTPGTRNRGTSQLLKMLNRTKAWQELSGGRKMTKYWLAGVSHATISWLNDEPQINAADRTVQWFMAAARELLGEEVDAQTHQAQAEQAS